MLGAQRNGSAAVSATLTQPLFPGNPLVAPAGRLACRLLKRGCDPIFATFHSHLTTSPPTLPLPPIPQQQQPPRSTTLHRPATALRISSHSARFVTAFPSSPKPACRHQQLRCSLVSQNGRDTIRPLHPQRATRPRYAGPLSDGAASRGGFYYL